MKIKKLLLPLFCAVSAISIHAGMRPFQHDELLAKMYLQVDMSGCPRIVLQQIALDYVAWIDEMRGEATTKEDSIYMHRLSVLFGDVFISYHYGN